MIACTCSVAWAGERAWSSMVWAKSRSLNDSRSCVPLEGDCVMRRVLRHGDKTLIGPCLGNQLAELAASQENLGSLVKVLEALHLLLIEELRAVLPELGKIKVIAAAVEDAPGFEQRP